MADLQRLTKDGGSTVLLPAYSVLQFSGIGGVSFASHGRRLVYAGIVGALQSIGPFTYEVTAEVSAFGDFAFQVFDLSNLPQADLATVTTCPTGTRAWVTGDGSTYSEMYWDGAEWIVANAQSTSVQIAEPADGDTVQMFDNPMNGLLRIQAPSPLSVLIIAVPSATKGRDGQVRRILFEVDVASVVFSGPAVRNPPTSAANGDSCTLQRLEASQWSRMF